MLPKKYFSSLIALVMSIFIFATATVNSSPTLDSDPKSTTSTAGTLKGSFQVTPTGQAHYSIPVEVPPGTAGMTPALSIAYDSSSSNIRNGLLGMGISLEGLTAITRCPSNKTQNGLIHGVDFTDQDRFCFNGEQLVAIKGAYGADGTEYRTYIDSKTKIMSYGRQGNGPASFKVWTKGGQITEYGLTADSQIKAEGKDSVAVWSLNKIQDTVGNYLEVHYFKDEAKGTYYPIEINYTGNNRAEPRLLPYSSVKFIYEDRPDAKVSYQAGSKNTLDKRLKTIQTYQGSTLVYEYRLNYEISKNTFRSRITSIEKCTGSGICLPPTKFEWQTNEEGWVQSNNYKLPDVLYGASGSPVAVLADLNGDGLPDYVKGYSAGGKDYTDSWLNEGNGWIRKSNYNLPDSLYGVNGSPVAVLADLNGDGLPDYVKGYGAGGKDYTDSWLNEGNGWIRNSNYNLPDSLYGTSGSPVAVLVDLNGDGLPDYVKGYGAGGKDYTDSWLNEGNGWTRNSNYKLPDVLYGASGSAIATLADLNGDGLPDYVKGYSAGGKDYTQSWLNEGNGWRVNGNYSLPGSLYLYNNGSPVATLIDVNGDGLLDYVKAVNIDKNSYLDTHLNRATKLPDYLISVTDGLGSKLSIDYEPLSGTKVKVYTKEHDAKYPNMDWQGPMYVVYQTSSNADPNDPKAVERMIAYANAKGISSQEALNHITTYHYTGAKFNHLGLGFLGFHQVTSTDNSTGLITTTTYSQDINAQNKGSPTASETRLADGTLVSSSEDTWDLKTFGDGSVNNTYYSPYVKTSTKKSFDLKGTLLSISAVDNTLDNYGNPTKIVSSVQDAATQKTHTTTTENSYHDDPQKWFLGRLIAAKVTKTGMDGSQQTRMCSFHYDPGTSLLIQTMAEPDDEALFLTTKYERDVFGNIITTTISGQGIVPRVSKVRYDDYGRFVIQTTNPLNQTASQVTDPRFGVVTQSTDLNGQKTFYQYDDFARSVLQVNPDNTTIDIKYNWFNPWSAPDGEIRTALKNVAYVVISHAKDSTTQNEYYDVLGRKVASTTQNMDGKSIWELTYYDELGRVTQKTLPFFQGDPIYYNKIQYDILGRITQNFLPDGNSTQIVYDGFTTTTINQLKQKQIKQVNALGELIKTIDNLGSVTTYRYDAYGNMIAMIDSAKNESRIEYDRLGRKIAINDPDKGRWTYQYDVLSNLISQTDALNQTTTFKYDKLNRTISRTDHAGTSTWEYDTAANGIGKLAKVNSLNLAGKGAIERLEAPSKALHDGLEAHTKSYNYDSLGRAAQVTTVIKNQSYVSSYSYDKNSRLDIETYPSGLKVKNSYNEFGYLVQISDVETGKVYWHLNAKDAQGHIISESRSNGLITNYTYEPETGFLKDIDTVLSLNLTIQKDLLPELTAITIPESLCKGKDGGICSNLPQAVQKESYKYDPLGNVRGQYDNVNGVSSGYRYDELNRLTEVQTPGRQIQTFRYDALGNIIYKSDVGAYKYGENGAGPHAVTSIVGEKPATFQYDANGDQVAGSIDGIGRNITYTSYNKPLTIKTAKAEVSFYYNADREKFARVDNTASKIAITHYLGNYEVVTINITGGTTITQQKAYIGPNTLHIKTEDSSNSKNNRTEIFEILHNNLGSVTDITDWNGNVGQHFEYTPFGEQKQTRGGVSLHPVTYKGFTGHEEIDVDGINLIHMDGRIYDPVIGRFLSADPYVQDPANSQCLNRYSYCINNPLAFVDPSGFGFFSSLFRSIGNAVKSVFNSSVGRIITGAVVGILLGPVGIGLHLAAAAAIGAGTTMGLGVATGASWKQILFEGAATFGIVAGVSYAAEKGTFSAWTQGGSGSGVSGGVGFGVPLDKKGDNESPRVPQGGHFPDQTANRNTENTAQETYANSQSEATSRKSNRAALGSNYSNGAGSGASAEMYGSKNTFSQRCEFCWDALKHDSVAQTAFALSTSALPIPKSFSKEVGLINKGEVLGSSRFTNIYSVINSALPKDVRLMLKTSNSLFKELSSTPNIIRGIGRITQVIAPTFLVSYSATRMFRCVTEQWDQSGE